MVVNHVIAIYVEICKISASMDIRSSGCTGLCVAISNLLPETI